MSRYASSLFLFLISVFVLLSAGHAGGQTQESPSDARLKGDLAEFVATPAVSGYEGQLGEKIRARIANLHPAIDNLGDITVTMGSGAPRRLIVAPIDEPGLVVSGITDDGYLRVQRLPQGGLVPIYNELYAAQPVKVKTTGG